MVYNFHGDEAVETVESLTKNQITWRKKTAHLTKRHGAHGVPRRVLIAWAAVDRSSAGGCGANALTALLTVMDPVQTAIRSSMQGNDKFQLALGAKWLEGLWAHGCWEASWLASWQAHLVNALVAGLDRPGHDMQQFLPVTAQPPPFRRGLKPFSLEPGQMRNE